ncbi:MAG: ribonuclease P protein component [bacterium]
MIAKTQKVPKNEIPSLMKAGRALSGAFWTVRYGDNMGKIEKNPIFLAIVGLKGTKTAVNRNKIKRLAYSVFDSHKNGLDKGLSILSVFKGQYTKAKEPEIKADLEKLLQKLPKA